MNPQEAPYSEEYSDGLRALNEYYGLDPENLDVERIARRLYKETSCGAWMGVTDTHLRVGSIVEGCDFGTAVYAIPWSEFNMPLYEECIVAIETEADALAVYLGSHESRGMTGQSILLDGGMVMV
jgi:hypothetical protein